MSTTFSKILDLVRRGEVRISEHGYDELAADDIFASDLVDALEEAEVLEDYPDYPKGPCVLVMQKDGDGSPVHSVWGIPRGKISPAVLVTAYRPDPERWTADFRKRRR